MVLNLGEKPDVVFPVGMSRKIEKLRLLLKEGLEHLIGEYLEDLPKIWFGSKKPEVWFGYKQIPNCELLT